jgi:hypothetical protein
MVKAASPARNPTSDDENRGLRQSQCVLRSGGSGSTAKTYANDRVKGYAERRSRTAQPGLMPKYSTRGELIFRCG